MDRIKQKNQRIGVPKLRCEIAPSTDMTNPIVAGVDLGDFSSVAAVLSPSGDVMERLTFKMNSEGYRLLSDRLPEGTKIACEAMGVTYPFFRAMHEQYGFDVTVANPKELAWIVKSKKKSDKIDSLKLGKAAPGGNVARSTFADKGGTAHQRPPDTEGQARRGRAKGQASDPELSQARRREREAP